MPPAELDKRFDSACRTISQNVVTHLSVKKFQEYIAAHPSEARVARIATRPDGKAWPPKSRPNSGAMGRRAHPDAENSSGAKRATMPRTVSA